MATKVSTICKVKVKATDFTDCLEFLSALFDAAKRLDDSYTYKVFADELGYAAASNIHNVVSGKRHLTEKSGGKIAKAIGLNKTQTDYFLLLIKLKNTKQRDQVDEIYSEMLALRRRSGSCNISDEEHKLFSEWYHLVIKELISIPGLDQSPEALANLTEPKLRPQQVEKSIETLLSLGMVKYDVATATLVPVSDPVISGPETEGMLIVNYHHTMLDMSKRSIGLIDENERNISASVLRVNREQIELFKEKVYQLQLEMLEAEPSPEDTDNVYQLNFQFFPVAKNISKDKEKGEDT